MRPSPLLTIARGRLAVTAVALAVTTACAGSLTTNHKQGLSVVGGFAAVMGATLLVDGMSCDPSASNPSCDQDGAELRNGVVMVAGGGALLTWALLMLSGERSAPEGSGPRTARTAPK